MNSDADDLLLFARVMEAGSFSRAAERLRLPKSTVSRRIAGLERRLGEKLLQRTTRKLSVTAFGEDVLLRARSIAAEVEDTLSFAQHRQTSPRGRLRVSMPGDFASYALAPTLARFAVDHPDVSLELDLSPRRVDLVGEGFDLAVRMGALDDDAQLAARRLAVFHMGLYASPAFLQTHGNPDDPEALRQLPALMMMSRAGEPIPWRLERRHRGGTTETREIDPPRRTTANAPDLLLRMARQDAGVAAATDFFTMSDIAERRLERVLPEWTLGTSTAWAVFPGRRLLPLRTRLFIEVLAAVLAPCNPSEA